MAKKVNLICVLVIGLMLSANVMASANYYVDASDYAKGKLNDVAIKAAIDEIGSKERTLLLAPGSWEIKNSISIPLNVNLRLEHGAKLNIADSKVVAINGPMNVAGINQIFFGKGKVEFGQGYIKEVYPQWWGKVGTADDTAVCQTALDCGAKTIRFLAGIYSIDAVGGDAEFGTGLQPASNTTLIFDNGSKLKAIANGVTDYTILQLNNKSNVAIYGVTIEGERELHTGEGGEWGHGIRIRGNSSNITIKDSKVSNCWGDGIYLGEGCPDGVYVENSVFDNNRRQGCSITDARNVLFKKCTFSNTNGTSPQKGVDIELNKGTKYIHNIVFEDCYSFKNLSQGFSIAYDYSLDTTLSVIFRGCVSDSDGTGFGVDQGPDNTNGTLFIENCTVISPKESGFRYTSADLAVKIDGLTIINPNQNEVSAGNKYGPALGSAFVVWGYGGELNEGKVTGNIVAENVNIVSDDNKVLYALYLGNTDDKGGLFGNFYIELKTNVASEKRFYKGKQPFVNYCKVEFSDAPVFATASSVGDEKMAAYIGQKITNKGAVKDIVLSLNHPRAVTLDSEYTIEVASPHKITLDMSKCPLLPGGMTSYWSDEVGSRLKIRSDGKNWYIMEKVGKWNLK